MNHNKRSWILTGLAAVLMATALGASAVGGREAWRPETRSQGSGELALPALDRLVTRLAAAAVPSEQR